MKNKKILFLYLGAENLGIQALSSCLKREGHEVELLMDPAIFSGSMVHDNKLLSRVFDSGSDDKFKKAIIRSNPDIIGFSVFTGNYIWALKWAGVCKEIFPNVPIVFGGIHPTSLPDQVMRNTFVDMVVVGEGEDALLEVLSGLNGSRLPSDVLNTVVRANSGIVKNPIRPYIRNLDAYPLLDKQLFYDKIPDLEECYLTITSRGCPFICTYCVNNVFHDVYDFEKNHIRKRGADSVIEELIIVKKRGKAKKIFFGDDVFIFNKGWLEDFTKKYKKEIGLPFWCTAYPTIVDKDIIKLLKEAGCWLITMGVQSGSPRIRQGVFKRIETNESIIKASSIIKGSGIILGLDNIFGAPSEKESDLIESMELYSNIKPQRIHTFWLTYFPRTSILLKAVEVGDLNQDDVCKIENGYVGQFDFGGMVKSNVRMYLKYEFMYHFLSLVGYNDVVKRFFLKWKRFVPASSVFNKALIVLNAIKDGDTKFFYLLRSMLFKRNVP